MESNLKRESHTRPIKLILILSVYCGSCCGQSCGCLHFRLKLLEVLQKCFTITPREIPAMTSTSCPETRLQMNDNVCDCLLKCGDNMPKLFFQLVPPHKWPKRSTDVGSHRCSPEVMKPDTVKVLNTCWSDSSDHLSDNVSTPRLVQPHKQVFQGI